MYENFKGDKEKYKTELERILAEDCEITAKNRDFIDPEKRKWKTSVAYQKDEEERRQRANL